MQDANSQNCSHAEEIAAYLDDELSFASERAFGQHLAECAECAEKLNVQKRLLCALNFAFDDEKSFELPINFAKSVAVRAESDVSGLRSKEERRRAMLITSGLLSVEVLVGIAGGASGFLPAIVENSGRQILAVLKVLVDSCYDFGFGLSVILRVIGRNLSADSTLTVFISATLLLVSFVVLRRLLFKFRRTQQSS